MPNKMLTNSRADMENILVNGDQAGASSYELSTDAGAVFVTRGNMVDLLARGTSMSADALDVYVAEFAIARSNSSNIGAQSKPCWWGSSNGGISWTPWAPKTSYGVECSDSSTPIIPLEKTEESVKNTKLASRGDYSNGVWFGCEAPDNAHNKSMWDNRPASPMILDFSSFEIFWQDMGSSPQQIPSESQTRMLVKGIHSGGELFLNSDENIDMYGPYLLFGIAQGDGAINASGDTLPGNDTSGEAYVFITDPIVGSKANVITGAYTTASARTGLTGLDYIQAVSSWVDEGSGDWKIDVTVSGSYGTAGWAYYPIRKASYDPNGIGFQEGQAPPGSPVIVQGTNTAVHNASSADPDTLLIVAIGLDDAGLVVGSFVAKVVAAPTASKDEAPYIEIAFPKPPPASYSRSSIPIDILVHDEDLVSEGLQIVVAIDGQVVTGSLNIKQTNSGMAGKVTYIVAGTLSSTAKVSTTLIVMATDRLGQQKRVDQTVNIT